MFRTLLHVNC